MSSTRKRRLEPEEHLRSEEKRSAEGKEKALECIVSLFVVCEFLAKTFNYYENSYKEGVQLGGEEFEQFINEKSRIRFNTGESDTVQKFINDMCGPKITTKRMSNFKSLLGKKLLKIGLHLVHSDIDEIRAMALKITKTVEEDQKRTDKLKTKYDSFLVISAYLHHRINEKLSTPVRLEHSLLLKEWKGHETMSEQSKEQTEIEVKNYFKSFGNSAIKQSKNGKNQGSRQHEKAEESDEHVSTDGSDSDYEPFKNEWRKQPRTSRSHRNRVNVKPMSYVPTTAGDLQKPTNEEKNSLLEMPNLEANVNQDVLEPACTSDLPPPLSPIRNVGRQNGVVPDELMPRNIPLNFWDPVSPSMIPAENHSENKHTTNDSDYENENCSETEESNGFLKNGGNFIASRRLLPSSPSNLLQQTNQTTQNVVLVPQEPTAISDETHDKVSVLVLPENSLTPTQNVKDQRTEEEMTSVPLDGVRDLSRCKTPLFDNDISIMGNISRTSESPLSSHAPTESEFSSKSAPLEGSSEHADVSMPSETLLLIDNTSGTCSSLHDKFDRDNENRSPSAFALYQKKPVEQLSTNSLTAFTRMNNRSPSLEIENNSTIEIPRVLSLPAFPSTSDDLNFGSAEQSTHSQGGFNLAGILPPAAKNESHINLIDWTEHDFAIRGLPNSQSSSTSVASLFGQISTSQELSGFVPNNMIGLDFSHHPFRTMTQTDHQNFGNFAPVVTAFNSSQNLNQMLPSYSILPNYNVLAAPDGSSVTFLEQQSRENGFHEMERWKNMEEKWNEIMERWRNADHLHRDPMTPPPFEQPPLIPEQVLQHQSLNVDSAPSNPTRNYSVFHAVLPDNTSTSLNKSENRNVSF